MTITTLSSCDLDQDVDRAKRAALQGPVFITNNGTHTHVLLSIAEYRRLAGDGRSLAEALAMRGMEDIKFDPPKIQLKLKVPDFD